MSKLTIKRKAELKDLKKNLTLEQLVNKIEFQEDILAAGLVCILEKELEVTDRLASAKELKQYDLA